MKYLQRTKVYSFNEFLAIESNNDIKMMDKQIGIWKRTNKKVYKAIIVYIAALLFASTLTIIPSNIFIYKLLKAFTIEGMSLVLMFNLMIGTFQNKGDTGYMIDFAADAITTTSILILIASYICSVVTL